MAPDSSGPVQSARRYQVSLKERILSKDVGRREFLALVGGGIAAVVVVTKLAWALKKPEFAAAPHRQHMVWKTKETVSEI